MFTDNDHRHAKLITRLNYDGISQADFFRQMITSYISGDDRVQAVVDELKSQSKAKRKKSKSLREAGSDKLTKLGLDESSIEDIFDLIAQEHPDL